MWKINLSYCSVVLIGAVSVVAYAAPNGFFGHSFDGYPKGYGSGDDGFGVDSAIEGLGNDLSHHHHHHHHHLGHHLSHYFNHHFNHHHHHDGKDCEDCGFAGGKIPGGVFDQTSGGGVGFGDYKVPESGGGNSDVGRGLETYPASYLGFFSLSKAPDTSSAASHSLFPPQQPLGDFGRSGLPDLNAGGLKESLAGVIPEVGELGNISGDGSSNSYDLGSKSRRFVGSDISDLGLLKSFTGPIAGSSENKGSSGSGLAASHSSSDSSDLLSLEKITQTTNDAVAKMGESLKSVITSLVPGISSTSGSGSQASSQASSSSSSESDAGSKSSSSSANGGDEGAVSSSADSSVSESDTNNSSSSSSSVSISQSASISKSENSDSS